MQFSHSGVSSGSILCFIVEEGGVTTLIKVVGLIVLDLWSIGSMLLGRSIGTSYETSFGVEIRASEVVVTSGTSVEVSETLPIINKISTSNLTLQTIITKSRTKYSNIAFQTTTRCFLQTQYCSLQTDILLAKYIN